MAILNPGRRFSMYLFFLMFASTVLLPAKEVMMRTPDIYQSTVVFCAGNDIWKAPAGGGVATRLTMHDGIESEPKFSPDGKLIAFTGSYDGNADIYVMDTNGGNIRRVTWHPGNDRIIGWHPQNGKIIFSSYRDAYTRSSRLYLINRDGSGLEKLILHEVSQGSFSPDGQMIAYNRVSRENRTWKRYKGGTAQEVYLYNLSTNEEQNITNFRGTDRVPMWIGDKIYFSSDRDRVLNIYSYNTVTKEINQITHHTSYDVRRPGAGEKQIVYELGGEIWSVDLASGQTKKIDIQILSDLPETRPYYKKVDEFVTRAVISPGGKRALIEARGDIFSVPQKDGSTRNLTNSSAARDKDAAWSPDGKSIAFISDRNGEYQVYMMPANGSARPTQLTDFKTGYLHTLRWSPDSKYLTFTDQTLTLYILKVKTKQLTRVDKAEYENIDVSVDLKPIYDFNWSPDSRYLAYSKMDASLVNKIYIYDLAKRKIHEIGNGMFNDFHPVFSTDGAHLFFISNRRFDPTYGDMEWEMVYKNIAGIYALTLQKDGKPLFPLTSDEEPTQEKSKADKKEAVKTVIDFAGLNSRIEALPLKPANYRNLAVNETTLFYLNKDKGDFNRFEFRSHMPMDLFAFSLEDQKESTVIKSVDGYQLSADGSHLIYRKGHKAGIIKSSARDAKEGVLNLADLSMQFDPRAEWQQIFDEAWRIERDFYYEPNMHGIDWPAMHEKYGRMLKKATCRRDVGYVIGELIGELNTSHTYVFGGDNPRKAERVSTGLIGADFGVDSKSKRYTFKKIYNVPEWLRSQMPPLAGPGKDISEGEYLLQVNGQDVTTDKNVYSFFTGLSGKQVTLTVNDRPQMENARKVTIKATGSEYMLRYLAWVEHNRQLVDKISNGQIGYLHLPDTYNRSAQIFPRYYYSQTTKKGIIVDGRYNGGGLDPDIFLERLNKRPLSYWTRRYSHDYFSPWLGTRAHLVCLTNRQAGSGGDELPELFRLKKMGPVIGTRSWGGLVGVSMFYRMIDGGGLSAPDYRIYNAQGKWIVEGEGVTPDIEIDLKPAEMARDYDAQLMKAVEVLQQKIKEDPLPWPQHEPFPVDR